MCKTSIGCLSHVPNRELGPQPTEPLWLEQKKILVFKLSSQNTFFVFWVELPQIKHLLKVNIVTRCLECFIITNSLFFFLKIYLVLEEKTGRETFKYEREISCLWHAHNCEHGPQPRHVPWLGIELVTLWFAGQHLIHWATPAKVNWE